jgi:hypothetical protein
VNQAQVAQELGSPRQRVLSFYAELNQLGVESWEAYRDHRAALMTWVTAQGPGESVLVLGAGNCNDLELSVLASQFREVHLADIDEVALERGSARLRPEERARVTLHPGLDLSGCLDRIDAWGEAFPDPIELRSYAENGAGVLSAAIGRRFDVVLSDCLLSQLCAPVQSALALSVRDWTQLFSAVTRLHLMTLILLTNEGGPRCWLVTFFPMRAPCPRSSRVRCLAPSSWRS